MELQLRDGDKQFSLYQKRLVRRFCRKPERFAGPACSERCASLSEWGQPSAVMTEVTRAFSFAIPVTLLVMVLSVCE